MALEFGVRDRGEFGDAPRPSAQAGPPSPSPVPPPAASLAFDAHRIAAWAQSRRHRPDWAAGRSGAQVQRIRAQLEPIRSRASLEASFEREAFHSPAVASGGDAPRDLEASPVRIAYALRWLELGDGIDGRG